MFSPKAPDYLSTASAHSQFTTGSPAKEQALPERYSSFNTQQAYVEQQCHHTSKAPITCFDPQSP